jgi:hypothetical protein
MEHISERLERTLILFHKKNYNYSNNGILKRFYCFILVQDNEQEARKYV